ncbi:adenosine monophosphate-protein transferase SoFic [Clostridium homopropionicum DSM 5847]|uniref:Adenosine monophosphate-protein transferase SoFic n=1 Tax=Clostridium homopropionicum DSM 5847 TaxID=1121318 RepID=A0A0L6Z870_9CLOT|nr:Fic/DOC family N-terminal domain-containing protein [Clostridium homopropionicum]KOA19167.1 adenosine monophosphate-protein transferase SoFic [Clostridium homopropionicum DSM 5847]SFG16250.1 Fic family protein [Clostridium homopropionicum]
MFVEAGKYEIQRDGACIYYTYTPKTLCGEDFIKTDEELTLLLSKAHRNLGILEGMAKVVPNIDIIESILIKREALLSCQIDRNTATFEGIMQTSKKKSEEEKIVLNYVNAVMLEKSRIFENQVSNNLICDIYKIIINDENKGEASGFRKVQIFDIPGLAGTSMKMYNPTAPEDIEKAMEDLVSYINRDDDVDKIIKTALAYYQFITISPFKNENNKMGRILINILWQHYKILSKQLLCISRYIIQDKIGFADRVSTVRIIGDYKQWIKYFLKMIVYVAEETITTIENLMQLDKKDTAKIMVSGKIQKNQLKLFEYLKLIPIIDIKQTALNLNMSYNTMAKSIEDLQELGILKQSNNLMRNRYFVYKEYLDIIINENMLLIE